MIIGRHLPDGWVITRRKARHNYRFGMDKSLRYHPASSEGGVNACMRSVPIRPPTHTGGCSGEINNGSTVETTTSTCHLQQLANTTTASARPAAIDYPLPTYNAPSHPVPLYIYFPYPFWRKYTHTHPCICIHTYTRILRLRYSAHVFWTLTPTCANGCLDKRMKTKLRKN